MEFEGFNPTQKKTGNLKNLRVGGVVFPEVKLSNSLSHTKLSAMETYMQVTFYGTDSIYTYLPYTQ